MNPDYARAFAGFLAAIFMLPFVLLSMMLTGMITYFSVFELKTLSFLHGYGYGGEGGFSIWLEVAFTAFLFLQLYLLYTWWESKRLREELRKVYGEIDDLRNEAAQRQTLREYR